jgi:ParD-like antitoxin of type II ParDE toxin-antitoxin system
LRVGSKMLPFWCMGQPVKLSENLVLDARVVGETAERSIAGQIEFWARLGRAVEPVLRTETALRLKSRGEAVPLSACLTSVDTQEGRERVRSHLASRPYPHFEPAARRPGLIVKIDEDGTRTIGRFVNRRFRPAKTR